jgi:Na+/glutamate symporter
MLHSPLLSVFVAIQIPIIVFMWIGVGMTLMRIHRHLRTTLPLIWIAFGVAFVMLLVGIGPGVIARFRLPAMPFLAMLAGVGWSGTWGRRVHWARFRSAAFEDVTCAGASQA